MRKVGFSISDTGRVTYAASLKGHTVVARASDYVLIDTDQVIGAQVVDEEWALKQARVDAAKSVEALASALIGMLALVRYRHEVGGITLPNGTHVRTDDKTQARLTSAQVQFQKGVITEVRWKMDNGAFVKLQEAQLTGIAAAVTAHVAACFAAEDTVTDQINSAATVADLQAIDPETEFSAALAAITQPSQ